MAAPTCLRPSLGLAAAAASPGSTISLARSLSLLQLSGASPATAAQLPTIRLGLRQPRCPFSTTPAPQERRVRRDRNRQRGVSSLYRSGPRFRMNVQRHERPQPAPGYRPRDDVATDPAHGLWQFFYAGANRGDGNGKLLLTPAEDAQHGRAWMVEELRHKSWEDLHKLWWVCVKEQNRIHTATEERSRMAVSEGAEESSIRLDQVRKTMKGIKHVLTERFYVWEDARELAENDPEVDLSSKTNPYTPSSYLEEEAVQPQPAEAQEPGSEVKAEDLIKSEPSKPADKSQDTIKV